MSYNDSTLRLYYLEVKTSRCLKQLLQQFIQNFYNDARKAQVNELGWRFSR